MTSSRDEAPSSGAAGSGTFRALLVDAVMYWEPRRIAYNLVLLAQAGAWVWATWPAFRPEVVAQHIPECLALAGLANLCYCAAYIVDLAIPASPERDVWRRWRWSLWVAGTLLALLIAQYWIGDEIYPSVL